MISALILQIVPWALMTVGAALVGAWSARLMAKTQTKALQDQAPIQALQNAATQAYGEAAAAREQLMLVITNHLAHDKEDRDKLSQVMSGVLEEQRVNLDAMRALHDDIKQHREQATVRFQKLLELLAEMRGARVKARAR